MTLSNPSPTILMVPGLRDHVAEHWQTLLEAKLRAAGHKAASVQPLEVDRLSCEARVAALDKAVSTKTQKINPHNAFCQSHGWGIRNIATRAIPVTP